MTFSVVALDGVSGELGVAVHSCYPGVAAVVAHVEHGIGAVATQAAGDPALAKFVLALLGAGLSPSEALDRVLASDSAPESRQLAVVAASGEAAAYTGSGVIGFAGHVVGEGFVVAANIAASGELVGAMAAAYLDHAQVSLPDRLLACLVAAQATGGDLRGLLSAGLLVAGGLPFRLDVRVDVSASPIDDLVVAAGDIRAYALVDPSVEELVGLARTPQPLFWHLLAAAALPGADHSGLAVLMRAVVAQQPTLATALGRMDTLAARQLAAALARG